MLGQKVSFNIHVPSLNYGRWINVSKVITHTSHIMRICTLPSAPSMAVDMVVQKKSLSFLILCSMSVWRLVWLIYLFAIFNTDSCLYFAMLKYVSLWNQCDIPHSGIVCDITLLQNFFFDITHVLSEAYVACSILSHGVFTCSRWQLIKTFVNKQVTCYFSPIPCLL